MFRRPHPACLFLLALAALPGTLAAEPFSEFKAQLEEHLRIELDTCPDGMLGPNEAEFILWCGSYDEEPKKFRSLWSKTMYRIRELQREEPDSGWKKIGDRLRRFQYWHLDTPAMVLHYTEQGVIVIGLDRGTVFCEAAGLAERGEDVRFINHTTPGAVNPERTHHVFPEYPVSVRQHRLEGTVRDLCVSEAVPDHRGFKKSAVEAIRKWRYKPGTLNGEPAPFHIQILVTFSIH